MIRSRRGLEALVACLCGRLPNRVYWQGVIALANHTLLTPALYASLDEADELQQVPSDVRDYLFFIHTSNRERNLRLLRQLHEAVSALNRHGIAPTLLKGAVPLFLSETDILPARMTSDLDLGVEATEEARALACLRGLGYRPVAGERGMARPQDVGLLELRQNWPDSRGLPTIFQRAGVAAKIPSPPSRAMHWIVHDLLKEGDYLRGRIDLRHLHDLAQLTKSDNVDWAALRRSIPVEGALNAFDTQLLALHHLFRVEIPEECFESRMARLQHWRRIYTAKHPIIGAPLRLAGTLVWGALRLSQIDAKRREPADIMRRATRTILNRDVRSKV